MKIFPIGAGQSADTASLSAKKVDVKRGKTAYVNGYDDPVTGEMPEYSGTNTNGTSTELGDKIKVSPTADGYYNTTSGLLIPKTTVANSGGLTANKLAYGETAFNLVGTYKGKGNAVANQVLNGATFSTANLSNATGTIPIVSGKTIVPSTNNQVAMYPSQYSGGQVNVTGDPNLRPENIAKGKTIFGVEGTAVGTGESPLWLARVDPDNKLYHLLVADGMLYMPNIVRTALRNTTAEAYYSEYNMRMQVATNPDGWCEVLSKLNDKVIFLNGYSKIVFKITTTDLDRGYSGAQRIGVNSDGSNMGNNFNAVIDLPYGLRDGVYHLDISNLNGGYWFYTWQSVGHLPSRGYWKSDIIIQEIYLLN